MSMVRGLILVQVVVFAAASLLHQGVVVTVGLGLTWASPDRDRRAVAA